MDPESMALVRYLVHTGFPRHRKRQFKPIIVRMNVSNSGRSQIQIIIARIGLSFEMQPKTVSSKILDCDFFIKSLKEESFRTGDPAIGRTFSGRTSAILAIDSRYKLHRRVDVGASDRIKQQLHCLLYQFDSENSSCQSGCRSPSALAVRGHRHPRQDTQHYSKQTTSKRIYYFNAWLQDR